MTPSVYLANAHSHGCPPDQLRNFLRARILLQAPQLRASAAARSCDKPDGPTSVGYGGARGGGKSHWLLAQMGADDCQRLPGLKCLLLRKVGKANLENFDDIRRRLFRSLPHYFSPHRGLLQFPNGSRIISGHYRSETDIDRYLGIEYDVIGIEEATTLTRRKVEDLSASCRTSKPWRPRIYSTTNPGGVGHAWYKSTFISPFLARQEIDTRFIPARSIDNPFYNPEYRKVLSRLTGWQKRAWADGDWDLAAGQYFTTFRRDIHVLKKIDDTLAREWSASLDYGFTHYTVVHLGFKDGDGNFHIVDEHAERQWLPQRHAPAIKAMFRRHGLDPCQLARFVAGADVFSRQGDGATVAGAYEKLGLNLTAASMDRINGWAEILRRLGDPAACIRPSLFIHDRCRRLIDCLPSLQHDPNRPEDVLKVDCDDDGHGGDDPADSLRYLIQTNPRQILMMKLGGF